MSWESIRETLYSRPMDYTVMIVAAIVGTAALYCVASKQQPSNDAKTNDLTAIIQKHEVKVPELYSR